MAHFKLVRVMMGSGWPSAHVAVDKSYTFPGKAGGAEQCLTLDAETYDEFADEIDTLIAELTKLKDEAKTAIPRWQSEWRLARERDL